MTNSGDDPRDWWDQRYGEAGFAYGDQPNDFLREVADHIPGGPVLCLAEGEGRNAVFLAGTGRHAVTAVDLSPVGLAKAARLAADRGLHVETVVSDLADLEIAAGHWAGVISIWAHTPPAIRQPLHRRVVAGLRPGGVLVLEAYTPAQIGRGTGGPPLAEMTMSLAGLRQELAGLAFELGVERLRMVHEGRYHQGESAVVQLLARKPG